MTELEELEEEEATDVIVTLSNKAGSSQRGTSTDGKNLRKREKQP